MAAAGPVSGKANNAAAMPALSVDGGDAATMLPDPVALP
jgi:hypothetical protein